MTTATLTRKATAPRLAGGAVRPLLKKSRPQQAISGQTLRTFAKISDPANVEFFTADAAFKAFGHIKS